MKDSLFLTAQETLQKIGQLARNLKNERAKDMIAQLLTDLEEVYKTLNEK